MKLIYTLFILIVIILSSCKKENELLLDKQLATVNTLNSTAITDSAYSYNYVLSMPAQYIATQTHTQNSGEATEVYTTFKTGHIDSLFITMSKQARFAVQTMYANGNPVYFKSIHDTVGKVAVDLTGDPVNGTNIPIRTIFNVVGQGYHTGAVFKPVLLSMRIDGITHKDSIPAPGFMLVGSKPQITLEKSGTITNNTLDTLLTIDLKAVSDFVVIQDIPIIAQFTNATINSTTLQAIDSLGRSVGTVTSSTIGKNMYITVALTHYFKVYPSATVKLYLLGTMSLKPNWNGWFLLDKPSKFVWDDDTYKVFSGKSNETYLSNSLTGDYSPFKILYP